MKLKSRGFTLFELLLLLAVIVVIATLIISFSAKYNPNSNQPTNPAPISISSNSEIAIKEKGWHGGRLYVVFEDKTTKTRIFYFDESMVILPPETNGN